MINICRPGCGQLVEYNSATSPAQQLKRPVTCTHMQRRLRPRGACCALRHALGGSRDGNPACAPGGGGGLDFKFKPHPTRLPCRVGKAIPYMLVLMMLDAVAATTRGP